MKLASEYFNTGDGFREAVTTAQVATTEREGVVRTQMDELGTQQDVNWYLWDELATKIDTTTDQDIAGDKIFTGNVTTKGYAYIDKTSSQDNGIMPRSFILHSDSEVLTEAKVYVDQAVETKLDIAGDTMTGELKVYQPTGEAISVTQDGTTDTFVVWSSGAVVADQVKVVQTTPGNDDNLTSKLYVDTEIAANSGIEYLVPGRLFEYDGVEDSWFRIDTGKFGIFSATSQLTGSLSEAKFLVVHQDDKDGFVFHTKGLGISDLHVGIVSILDIDGRFLGAWDINTSGAGLLGASSAGKYVISIPLGEWKGASSAAIISGSTYNLSSTLWGK
jgi:hypothetical protein